MAKKRMGASPLDVLTKKTASDRPAKKAQDPREAEIRAGVKSGKAFYNYYAAASGELIQKVPVYFPLELVDRLKMRGIKERRTLSEIVRRAVIDYLGE